MLKVMRMVIDEVAEAMFLGFDFFPGKKKKKEDEDEEDDLDFLEDE